MGSTGSMNITIEEKKNVIVVDSALLQYTGNNEDRSYYCYVLEEGLPTIRNVSVGIVTNAKIEVTEGLEEGEEIVTNYRY